MHSLRRYLAVPRSVFLLLAAMLILDLVHAVIFLTCNIFLREQLGYDDATIANVNSYRFLGVLALALPVGLYLKGRALKPFFLAAGIIIPSTTWLMVMAGRAGNETLLCASFFVWGIGMMLLHVAGTPFIVRETDDETRPEALSMSFATGSLAIIFCGLLIPWLASIGEITIADVPWSFDEAGIIQGLAVVSLAAWPLLLLIREKAPPEAKSRILDNPLRTYDWDKIGRAMAPTLVIAVGAGLTIPFMNLFFNSVYGLTSEQFSQLGGITGVLVFLGALLNPIVKRRFGYSVAILLSQSIAVFFLVLVAVSEILHPHVAGMFWIASVAYVLRQPFMNMAQPITTELTMSYVGTRNRELVSALGASIWSGSWFLSAKIFQSLRGMALEYYQIFFVTAGLYVVGIVLYRNLIRTHENRGLKE